MPGFMLCSRMNAGLDARPDQLCAVILFCICSLVSFDWQKNHFLPSQILQNKTSESKKMGELTTFLTLLLSLVPLLRNFIRHQIQVFWMFSKKITPSFERKKRRYHARNIFLSKSNVALPKAKEYLGGDHGREGVGSGHGLKLGFLPDENQINMSKFIIKSSATFTQVW